MPDIAVLVFANREPRTIERAVLACVRELDGMGERGRASEILVVAPDDETRQAVELLRLPQVRCLQDQGRGKPAAVNLALSQVNASIVIFTDGDVYVREGSFRALLAGFAGGDGEGGERVGAVSGHPIPQDSRDTKYGFWAHILTDAGAHQMRLARVAAGESIEASAYLMAVRRELIKPIPEDALADDQIISFDVLSAGARIAYAPDAQVFVKYPTNFHDWKLQKVRSLAGYFQSHARGRAVMRSGGKEASGLARLMAYPQGVREWWWFLQLVVARAWVWVSAWWAVHVRRKSFSAIWQRVESTK